MLEFQTMNLEKKKSWIDELLVTANRDQALKEFIGKVSNNLGKLVVGHYDSKVKQCILLELLGEPFFKKHFTGEYGVDINSLKRLRNEVQCNKDKKYNLLYADISKHLEMKSISKQ